MIDADYVCNFTCPICKDSPETLVLDGITMGTVKELPESSHVCDENSNFIQPPSNDPIKTGLLRAILIKIDELNNNEPFRTLVEGQTQVHKQIYELLS